jgi:hypothetical protein
MTHKKAEATLRPLKNILTPLSELAPTFRGAVGYYTAKLSPQPQLLLAFGLLK